MAGASAEPLEDLVRRFEARTLARSGWTHEAHLRVGLWYVLRLGPQAALPELRSRIRAYNEAVGTPNTADSGYHETLTRFYVCLIDAFLRAEAAGLEPGAAQALLLERFGARDLPLAWYTRERLFSREARFGWVEPDLRGLPGAA